MYEIIAEQLRRGRKGVLATIVGKRGAAPREQGARMLIRQDGTIAGTIGGGSAEAQVMKQAPRVMATQVPEFIHFTMNAREVADEGMLCGGDVDVFLEPLMERHAALYEAAVEQERRGKKAIIVTRVRGGALHKSLVDARENVWGDELTEDEAEGYSRYANESGLRLLDETTMIEPVIGTSHLYIFGAGHVSQYLARVGKMVDFRVVVIDDREEFANKDRFPEADEVIVDDFVKSFDRLSFAGREYVVIVTRGHSHDAVVLEEALKRNTAYIGMIGSKRKVKIVLDHLRAKGFSDDLVSGVYAPVGLDIHSETPQEIAVSIAGQLIKVRGEQ